ncbi:MAG: Rrf2 family transcriptional regulator [Ferruginibacter sp.]|nr:Rrf2 family transcriptional regulator [Ferruginibacter sp.]
MSFIMYKAYLCKTNATMISKTCEYAIRATLFIAQKSLDDARTGIKEIARNIDSPEAFIAKILQELGKAGLVLSAKGPNGGFYIDDRGMNNTLADIILAIDGDKLFTGCGLGLKTCSDKKPCPLHDEFTAIRQQIKNMMQGAKIGDFRNSLALGEKFLRR